MKHLRNISLKDVYFRIGGTAKNFYAENKEEMAALVGSAG